MIDYPKIDRFVIIPFEAGYSTFVKNLYAKDETQSMDDSNCGVRTNRKRGSPPRLHSCPNCECEILANAYRCGLQACEFPSSAEEGWRDIKKKTAQPPLRMHDFLTNTTPSARLWSLRGILTSRSSNGFDYLESSPYRFDSTCLSIQSISRSARSRLFRSCISM